MNLQKGQKIKLTNLTGSTKVVLKASIQMKKGAADITCFGVDKQDKLSDDRYFVFYNQTSTPEKAITMEIDNTSTSFLIDFNQIPSSIKKLVITVAADGDVVMQDMDHGVLSLLAEQQTLASFSFSGNHFTQEKALILCEVYEKDGLWRLSIVASGFNGGLSALLAHFGGEEISPVGQQGQILPIPTNPFSDHQKVLGEGNYRKNSVPMDPICLKKCGDRHKISLDKNNKEIHVHLNWHTCKKKGLFSGKAVDLDLACMYRLKTGEQGVIQALGNTYGCAKDLPFIYLDQDDRTGASDKGENMWFKKPELIAFAVVFAYIYDGVPTWSNTNAAVVLKQQGAPDIIIQLDNPNNRHRFCVIASITGTENQLEIKREERFFSGHKQVDQYYGFGFQWRTSHK